MKFFGLVVVMLGALGACGDDAPPPGAPGAPGAPAAAAAAANSTEKKLEQRIHVEDLVQCTLPEKIEGPVCDPKAPTCDTGYCLQTPAGFHCEPCQERDTIREPLTVRDFAPEQNRDPFESFVLVPAGREANGAGTPLPIDRTKECTKEQMIAPTYSYQDLRLVGIVVRGTQREVLMMPPPSTDPNNYGQLIKRGDCVGKEKAIVREIGTGDSDTGGYVLFQIHADATAMNPNTAPRPDEIRTVELYPGGVKASTSSAPPPESTAPIVTPKSMQPVAPPVTPTTVPPTTKPVAPVAPTPPAKAPTKP